MWGLMKVCDCSEFGGAGGDEDSCVYGVGGESRGICEGGWGGGKRQRGAGGGSGSNQAADLGMI